MKALVVGCGKVGSEIVRDLAASKEVSSVVAADASPSNLASLRPLNGVKTVRADVKKTSMIRKLMEDADIVCGALPGRLGFELMLHALEAGKNIVDIAYTPKDPFRLHRTAKANNCTLVPQCGVAPGLTNMCVGNASTRLERITRVRIFVGGLPQKPLPPLNYRIVFSLEDVINEYTRPVRLIENGTQKIVEPLSGRGILNFPGVGQLEYFLTDGLGTLTHSYPGVKEMRELTLRYPGHAEIVNSLRLLGFFRNGRVAVNSVDVQPRRFSVELLRPALEAGDPEDLLAFRVDVEGTHRGSRVLVRYQLLDKYDGKHRVTAMARTTAYPCTSLALLLGLGRIAEKGVVPPEKIAENPQHFGFVLSRLRARGVRMTRRIMPAEVGS